MTKIKLNETESIVPANAMGASGSSSGPINTFDPVLQPPDVNKKPKKKLRSIIFSRKTTGLK